MGSSAVPPLTTRNFARVAGRGTGYAAAAILGVLACPALAAPAASTMTFAVIRNDAQIGTHTVSVTQNGSSMTVQIATRVAVKLGFLTLYHFDQTDTEQWSGGKLVALNATTDDNGTVHRAEASNADGRMVVQSDGRTEQLDAATLPLNLWNPAILDQHKALNLQDGQLVNVSVADRGTDSLNVAGRTVHAHHYVVTTTYPQDVWYDDSHRLVRVEMKGRDGSTITYQMV